jgi:ADP-ribose pyrophosphatase YjhB (NUDIX family)
VLCNPLGPSRYIFLHNATCHMHRRLVVPPTERHGLGFDFTKVRPTCLSPNRYASSWSPPAPWSMPTTGCCWPNGPQASPWPVCGRSPAARCCAGETPEACVIRELEEELGLNRAANRLNLRLGPRLHRDQSQRSFRVRAGPVRRRLPRAASSEEPVQLGRESWSLSSARSHR